MRRTAARPLVGGVFLVLLLGMVLVGHFRIGGAGDLLAVLLASVQSWGRNSWVAFLLLQTLITISGFLPASLVGIAAGAVYGLLFGFGIATCSTLIGALVAFALGRSILRPWVERLVESRPHFRRLDDAISQDGWRNVALLRLSPVMPFALTSYTLGLTSITWRNYLLGTLASLPSLFCYVALGRLTSNSLGLFSAGASPLKLVMLGIGGAATVGLALNIGRIFRRGLAGNTAC